MRQVDMSPTAITARLRRVSQLRRLGLSLKKAKIIRPENNKKKDNAGDTLPRPPSK